MANEDVLFNEDAVIDRVNCEMVVSDALKRGLTFSEFMAKLEAEARDVWNELNPRGVRASVNPAVENVALRALGLLTSPCYCEVCGAGGSCLDEPHASTLNELVERLPWTNIAVALKALGLTAGPPRCRGSEG